MSLQDALREARFRHNGLEKGGGRYGDIYDGNKTGKEVYD